MSFGVKIPRSVFLHPFDLLSVSSNFAFKLRAAQNSESLTYLLELIYYMINHVVTMNTAPFFKKKQIIINSLTTLYTNHVEYFNY